jgi:hypothetical protein
VFPVRYEVNFDTFNPQKLALTSPTSGGRSVGIVLSRTKATGLLQPKVTETLSVSFYSIK